jgi:hypothetical protein
MNRLLAIITLVAVCATASAAEQSDAYTSAKLPALSREWHAADYSAVAAAIEAGTISLPTFSQESGAAILKRITATENLALVRNGKVPIGSRLQEMVTFGPPLQSLLRAYLTAAGRGEKVNAELAALLGFQLHLTAAQSRVVDEFIPTIPRDDKYAVRMDGVRLMRSGMTNVFLGATTSLTESHFYSADDISLMLEAMADTLPALKHQFAPDFRAELRDKLKEQRDGTTRSVDLQNLDRLLTELNI